MLPPMWRKLLHGAGCLGYLGLLLVIFGLVSYVAFSLFTKQAAVRILA